MRHTDGWLEYEGLFPGIYKVEAPGSGVYSYICVGRAATLVVDSAFGIGDLAGLAASFGKPVLGVLNTHGHGDHVLGNYQFDTVFIHEADSDGVVRHGFPKEALAEAFADLTREGKPEGLTLDAWNDRVPSQIVTVSDGYAFELGDRPLVVVHTPGHTPGSICLLDRAAGAIIVGDTLNPGQTWLQLRESLPLRTYLNSLGTLDRLAPAFERLASGHGPQPVPASLIRAMADCVAKILSGEIVGESAQTPVGECLTACTSSPCSRASIMYSQEKLG